MKTQRFWIQIMVVGTTVACTLALLIATLATVAGAAAEALKPEPGLTLQQTNSPAPEQVYEGMLTCSRCGARHSATIGRTATDCTRVCVHGGAAFALVDGDETYLLEGDANLLKEVAGQRVQIVGAKSGQTIRVSSVASSLAGAVK